MTLSLFIQADFYVEVFISEILNYINMKNLFVLFLPLCFFFACEKDKGIEKEMLPTNYIKGKNIVLSYDDTPLSDYSFIFETHKKLNIPGEISIWINNLKDKSKKTDALSLLQLKEMQDWGFDMASHSYYHTGLAPGVLLKTVNIGDLKLRSHINSVFTWSAIVPYTFNISDGKVAESISIQSVTSDEQGSFIKLRTPLRNKFPNGSLIAHSEEGLFKEIIESKAYLEQNGLKINHFTYPFGIADDRTHKFCKVGSYTSARNATPKRSLGKVKVVYEDKIENMYSINSLDFAYLSKEEIVDIIESPSSENVFIIFFSHSWDKNLTEDKISFLVEEGKKRGYKFTTRSDVFKNNKND